MIPVETLFRTRYEIIGRLILWTAVIVGLYVMSGHNYLLFHTLVELWAIAVAWGVFLLIWNARRLNPAPGLVMLGVGYLLVGALDLLHALAYDGLYIFDRNGPDLATQLWIAARYMESAVLILFPLSVWYPGLARTGKAGVILISLIFAGVILKTDWFPVCFDPETGLTPFKTISEYIIMAALLVAGALTLYQRHRIGIRVAPLLTAAIAVTIGSEFLFTLYKTPDGFCNMAGHLLKVLSFLLIFRALIVEGLEYPFQILAGDLEETRQKSRSQQIFQTMLLDQVSDAVIATDMGLRIVAWNAGASSIYGYTASEASGRYIDDLLRTSWPGQSRESARSELSRTGNWKGKVQQYHKNGRALFVEVSVGWIYDSSGARIGGVTINRDVTEQTRAEAEKKKLDLEIMKRDQILAAVSKVAGYLLERSVWDGVEKALQQIGDSAAVQRVYIFENTMGQDGVLRTSQRYEWAHKQVAPQKGNPRLTQMPYDDSGFRDWRETLSAGRIIASPVSLLPEEQRQFLSAQAIKSLAVVPIFTADTWWGFMGFDDCVSERQWHAAELDALRAAAGIFGAFVTRMQHIQELMTVSAREKNKLSRELHDGLCQDLKSLEIQAALLENRVSDKDGTAARMAASLGESANLAVKKAYAIVQGMFSVDMEATAFHTALYQMAEKVQPLGTARIRLSVTEDLIPPTRLHAYHLYRIAQEALINALRHSCATTIQLTWCRENRYMILTIQDNGTGFGIHDPAFRKGIGLQVMASRAQAIGAALTIHPLRDAGTQVCIRMMDDG